MTIEQSWPLQEAVFAHLETHLSGKGLNDVGNVAVFDHIPSDAPDLYVRLEGFGVLGSQTKQDEIRTHLFEVHVFDRGSGRGRAEVARIAALVVGALKDWSPINGASAISFLGSNPGPVENPATQHDVCRFSTDIGD